MQQATVAGRYESHHPIADALWNWRAEALWILAGVILMLAFGDALIVLALAFAIVAVAATWWTWTHRKVENRVQGNDAEWASVTHLRPALTGQRELNKTSAHAPYRGPSAA